MAILKAKSKITLSCQVTAVNNWEQDQVWTGSLISMKLKKSLHSGMICEGFLCTHCTHISWPEFEWQQFEKRSRYTRPYLSLVVTAVCALASFHLAGFFSLFSLYAPSVRSQGTLRHLNILHYADFVPCTFSFSSVGVQVQVVPFLAHVKRR